MVKEQGLPKLYEQLKEVRDAYIALRDKGFNEEVLIIYLKAKTKLSKKQVENFLNHIEEFYDNLIMDEVQERL